MATYLVLNLIFTSIIVGVIIFYRAFIWNKASLLTLIILSITTAIFDSLIILTEIVDYDYSLLLGIKIGTAPIEDFFYSLIAVMLVPSAWHYLKKEKTDEHSQKTI